MVYSGHEAIDTTNSDRQDATSTLDAIARQGDVGDVFLLVAVAIWRACDHQVGAPTMSGYEVAFSLGVVLTLLYYNVHDSRRSVLFNVGITLVVFGCLLGGVLFWERCAK